MTFNNIRESLSIYRILTILLISLLPYSFADAQIVKDIETFLKDDTTTHTTKEEKNAAGTAENETDSVKLIKVRKELEEAKINEANLKLQLELSKYQHDLKDSLKRAELKHKIDSLRNITKGVPVVVKDDTLFTIYAKWGGYTASERAEGIIQKIESLGKNITLKPDSVYIENTDLSTEIGRAHV